MLKYNVIGILLFLAATTFGQTNLTLQEAIDLGIQNNKEFKLKALEIAAAEARINELKATGLPQVTGGVNYQYYLAVPQQPIEDFVGPTVFEILKGTQLLDADFPVPEPEVFEFSFFQPHNLTANLNANWLIFDGSYLVGLEAARLYREVAAHSTEVSKQTIKNNITKAYLNVLLTDINANTLQTSIKNLEKIRAETQAIYTEGFVEQLDVERLDLSLMNLRNESEKLNNVTEIAKNVLKLQIGVPVEDDITLTEDIEALVNTLKLETVDLDEALAIENNPEYQQILYGQQLQELNAKRFRKSKLPTVSAFLGASESLQRQNLFDSNEAGWLPSASVGLNVNVPIYDGKMRKSQEQQSLIEVEKIKVQEEQFKEAKLLEVANAKMQFKNAQQSLTTAESMLALTNKIYDKTLIKYKEGVGSSLEVNQAESDVSTAQSNYINAIYTLINAKTDLDIALGK